MGTTAQDHAGRALRAHCSRGVLRLDGDIYDPATDYRLALCAVLPRRSRRHVTHLTPEAAWALVGHLQDAHRRLGVDILEPELRHRADVEVADLYVTLDDLIDLASSLRVAMLAAWGAVVDVLRALLVDPGGADGADPRSGAPPGRARAPRPHHPGFCRRTTARSEGGHDGHPPRHPMLVA